MKKSSFTAIRPYAAAKPPMAPGFADMPLNLLRTSLVTRQPHLTAEAAAQFIAQKRGEAQPPVYLPQSMQFGHWNRQNDGVNVGDFPPPTASAASLMSAMRQSGTARYPRVVYPVPQTSMQQAAGERGGHQIPQPGGIVPGPVPVSRRFPDPPPVDAPPPSAFAESHAHIQQLRRDERANARVYATSEAQASAQALNTIFRR